MNSLPVIGYRAIRKELWGRKGANIASRWKEMYGEKLFPRPETGSLERDQHFFAVVLSQMGLRNVEMRKMLVFVRITVKYVIKSTDKLICLRNVYFEIYIV